MICTFGHAIYIIKVKLQTKEVSYTVSETVEATGILTA